MDKMASTKESLISCAKCKNKVPLNDLKADKDGKIWICTTCYSLQHPDKQKSKLVQERDFNYPRLEESSKKFKYRCAACKFTFSRNTEFRGMCPYCNKPCTIEKTVL